MRRKLLVKSISYDSNEGSRIEGGEDITEEGNGVPLQSFGVRVQMPGDVLKEVVVSRRWETVVRKVEEEEVGRGGKIEMPGRLREL